MAVAAPVLPQGLGLRAVSPSASGSVMECGHLGGGRLWRVQGGLGRILRDAERSSPYGVAVLAQVEGRTRIELAGRACELGPGDLTFLCDRLPSAVEAEGVVGVVSVELPASACGRMDAASLAVRRVPETPVARVLHEAVQASWTAAGALGPAEATVGAVAALTRAVAGSLLGARTPAARLVDAATEGIERDLADPDLTARRVAEGRGVSRRHLDAVFRDVTGRTVDAWIRERRLVRAADLLASGAATEVGVYGVALECGFESASHFSRAFRSWFGSPPSRWPAGARPAGEA